MKWLIILSLALAGNSYAQNASQIEALTKRIEQLESQQEELILSQGSQTNRVNSFLRDDLTFGGFFESGFSTFDGPDTRFQSMYSGSTFGLNLSAQFSEKLRFVNQTITVLSYPLLNAHNNPVLTPKHREYGDPIFAATVTIGYLEMPLSPNLILQTGIGYVPFGYAAQQRETVLFIRRGGPQVLRTSNLIQPLWGGVHLAGTFRPANAGFNLYTVNPLDKSNTSGLGGRLWANSADDILRAGVSTQIMKFGGHTSEIIGADLVLNSERFLVTSEYVNHMTGEGRNPWTAYIEPAIKLHDGEVLLFVFSDYADDALVELGPVYDPMIRWENGVGINWLPTSNTRFRATAAREEYLGKNSTIAGQNRDWWYFDLSAGVAF
ncbi:MAG: hypothetical protein V4598_12420 [Bdellovibrionota bacterium]